MLEWLVPFYWHQKTGVTVHFLFRRDHRIVIKSKILFRKDDLKNSYLFHYVKVKPTTNCRDVQSKIQNNMADSWYHRYPDTEWVSYANWVRNKVEMVW